jgi:hypothetical protein
LLTEITFETLQNTNGGEFTKATRGQTFNQPRKANKAGGATEDARIFTPLD